MKRIGWLACLAALVRIACGAGQSSAESPSPNLIRNGGFEQGSEGWGWGQWKGLPEPGFVDRDNPHEGQASYTMTLAGMAGERLLNVSVADIDPTRDYELRLALRGKGLPEASASVCLLQWGAEKGEKVKPQGWVLLPGRPDDSSLITAGGAFDWREFRVHLYRQGIKPSTKRLTLYIRNSSIGKGELGVDDVSLRAVEPIEYKGPVAPTAEPPPAKQSPAPAEPKPAPSEEAAPVTPARTDAAASRELLLSRCDSTQGWALNTGREFPGAKGELTTARDGDRDVIRAVFDLSGGGRYVGAERRAGIREAEGILFEVRASGLSSFMARIRDATGQAHLASFTAPEGAWRAIALPLTKKTFARHWGGAKDGRIHFPLQAVLIGATSAAGGKGDFLLRNFGVRRVGPEGAWSVTVTTDQPGHIHFLEEAKVNVSIRVLNGLRQERTAPVAVQVVNLDGAVVAARTEVVRFAPWTPETLTLSPDSLGPGYFHVRVSVGDRRQGRGEGAFGVVPRPLRYGERDPASFFGMHSVKPDIAARIGVHWYRHYRVWRWGELHEGDYNYATELLQRCLDAGIDAMMCLDYQEPGWLKARTGPEGLPTEDALRRYADFVRSSVRAHPSVAVFEIQNEPDLELMAHRNLSLDKGVEFYARIVKTVAPIVRQEAPGIPIAGANVSGQDQKKGFPFCRAVIPQLGDLFDIWAPHPYASPRTFGPGLEPLLPEGNKETAKHEETLALAREAGKGHRYWIGEKGWEIRDEAPLCGKFARAFADCAARSLIIARSVPGLEKYFWFVLEQEWKADAKYTLFRGKPLQPMPAAVAYANVACRLDHAQPVGSLQLAGARIRVCVFERAMTDAAVAAIWCVSTPFVLEAALPDGASVSDLYGRPLPGGPLALSETPVFVRTAAAQAQALLKALEGARVAAAQPFDVAVAYLSDVRSVRIGLLNNTSRVVRVQGRADEASASMALLPSQERPSLLELALAQPVTGRNGRPLTVALAPREGKPVELSLPTALTPAPTRSGIAVDGRADDWQDAPALVLKDRSDVLPPDEAGWHGPDDLSVRVSLGWDEENLYLLVRVTDDVHHTPNASQFWKSDALQIGLDVMNDASDVPGYGDDDREYGAMVDASGTRAYQTHPQGEPRFRVVGARIEERKETLYELALPWSGLGRAPRAGMVFSLNLTVNDNDGAGMNYWMGLTPGIVEGKRPSQYRDFYLADVRQAE